MLCLCSPLLSASVEKEVSLEPRGGGERGSSGAVWGGAVVIAGEQALCRRNLNGLHETGLLSAFYLVPDEERGCGLGKPY